MHKESSSPLVVHLLLLLMILLASTSFPVGAMITHALSPEILMFLRFFVAAAMFLPFLINKKGAFPNRKSLIGYLILSLPLVIFFWCMFESLRYTSVLNTGAIYTVVPAITAIFAFIINRELTNKMRSFGLVLGTMGALWIVFRGSIESLLTLNLNYGDLIFFIGCIFLGLYNPLVKKFYRGEPMEIMTFWVLFLGSACLLLLSGKTILEVKWYAIESKVYWGILYLSLFSTLITFFILQYGVVRIGATKVGAYGFLTPLFVIIMSLILGMENFDPVIVPGMAMVLGALFLIQRKPRHTIN